MEQMNLQWQHLFETAADAMVVVDDSGAVLEVNGAACDLFGMPRQCLVNQSIRNFIEVWPEPLVRGRGEFSLRCRDGINLSVEYTATANVGHHLMVLRDITEYKRANTQCQSEVVRLRMAIEGAGDGIWDWNLQTNEVNFSRQWKMMLGYEEDEIQNQLSEWDRLVHPEDKARAYADINRYLNGETPVYHTEHRLLCKDGSYKWILDRGRVFEWDEHGKPLRFVGTHSDISDRKANELLLEELSQQLKRAQAVAQIGHWSFDLATQKITWSEQIFRIHGMDPAAGEPSLEELIAQIHPDDRPRFANCLNQASQGIPQNFDLRLINSEGKISHTNGRIELEYHNGKLVRMFGTEMDITDRKNAEQELDQFFNIALDLLCIADTSGRFRRLNRAWEKTLGYNLKELEGRQFLELVHPDDVAATLAAMSELSEQKPVLKFINRYRAKDGSYRYIEWLSAPQGELIYAAARDISDRKQAENQVKSLLSRTQLLNAISSEIRNSLDLDKILENTVRAVFAELQIDICTFGWYHHDAEQPTWEVVKEQRNSKVRSRLGGYDYHEFPEAIERVMGKQVYCLDTRDSDDRELATFCQDSGITLYFVLPIHAGNRVGALEMGRVSGDYPWQQEEIRLMQSIGSQLEIAVYQAQLYEEAQNTTKQLQRAYQDLQETQAQLVQSEKMSSLGQLVAGIAHEINNPVSFIYSNLQPAAEYASTLAEIVRLYQCNYPEPPKAIASVLAEVDIDYLCQDFAKLIRSMENGAVRIRDIVKSLRTFSRLDESGLKAVDLHENLDSTLILLQSRLNGHNGHAEIQVIRNYGQLPLVHCYSGLLNQVFMNLLTNAIDAIEERYHLDSNSYLGQITVITETRGNQVTITIQDNGIGMSQELQSRILNPFFTTKPVGRGTGMGLPISYQIITKDHQGKLYCSSKPREGTSFTIKLPVSGSGQTSNQPPNQLREKSPLLL